MVSVGLLTIVAVAVLPNNVLRKTNPNLPLLIVPEKIIFFRG